jgi:putative spermidine/putrescine transport system permease protein
MKKIITPWFSICVGMIYIFLITPVIIVILTSINSGLYLKFPPDGFSFQWFANYFSSGVLIDAFNTSVIVAFLSTFIATVLGTTASLFLVRYHGRLKHLYNVAILAPLLFPQILTSIALLLYYNETGMQNAHFIGLLIGHSIICLPYIYLCLLSVLTGYDWSLNEAARSLGASPMSVFWKITFPIIRPGMVSGAVFSFLISFDNFNISVLLIGPGTSVLPIQMYDYLRFEFDPTIAAVSTVNVLISLIVLVIVGRTVGIDRFFFSSSSNH